MKCLERRQMLAEMRSCFQKVRGFLMTEGIALREEKVSNPGKPNASDSTMAFDHQAEEIAIRHFDEKLKFPVRILSEERGEILLGKGSPICTLVMDPTDGSTNFRRGIEGTSFSVALVLGEVRPQNVEVAFIGSVISADEWAAIRGEGAMRNEHGCRSSAVTEISSAIIGIDLDFDENWKWKRIMPIINECHRIRRIGTAALEGAYVAHGGYDAMIDVRDMITPENFMAAYLIVKEAGGVMTDPFGNELPETGDLSKKHNWVASGNLALHDQIIRTLHMNI